MKRLKLAVCMILAVLCLAVGVCAEENKTYVVKIKPSEELFSASLFADDMQDAKAPDTPGKTAEFLLETLDGIEDNYYKHGYLTVNDDETLKLLESLGVVEYAEEPYMAELCGYNTGLNLYFSGQWGYKAINAGYALESGVFGDGVRVAVIDSGAYPHADLKHCLEEGYSYVTGTNNTVDILGHGTQVSGVIAAQCNNIGVVGIAQNVKIIPIQITNEGNFLSTNVGAAIRMAVDEFDCDVINMSLGITGDMSSVKNAVDYAVSKGVIIVAAAGNNSANVARYPAAYQNVVSVGNVAQSGDSYTIWSSSNWHTSLNIAAPGRSIYTTTLNNSYASVTGTSFSCPMVAAAAALAKQIDPDMTVSEYIYYLGATANSSYMTEAKGAEYWGKGLLDVEALVKYLLKNKTVYVSGVDWGYKKDNATVYIHNPKNASVEYTVEILADYPKTQTLSITVDAYDTREISLTDMGLQGQAVVNVYLKGTETVAASATQQMTLPKNTYKIISVDSSKVTVMRQRAAMYNAVMYVGLYSADGKLKQVLTKNIAMNDLESGVVTEIPISFDNYQSTDVIRAMVLDIYNRPMALSLAA